MSDSIGGPPAAAPAPTQALAPARRSRTGIWVTLSVTVVVLLIAGSCGLATWSLMSAGDGMPTGGDAVAVIYLDGQIAGVDSSGLGGGGYVTPERVIDELKRAEEDPAVKAIILRIDSPGGTASASWEIAIQVQRAKKPVIASIGDVGASGAYMIASQCDEIISTGSSDIGSIGVIMQVGDYSALLEKLGVKFISIHEGEFKDAGAPWRSLTATETAMLEADIKLVYDDFIALVAKGRTMKDADVRKLATGWAWPGVRAKELGLVDRIGNYPDAVDRAAKLGKIEGEPRIITYRGDSLPALLQSLTTAIDRLGALGAAGTSAMPARPTLR
jgi:protease-4